MQACVAWAKRAYAGIVSVARGPPPLHEKMADAMGVVCEAVWTDVPRNQVVRCVRSFRTRDEAHGFWLDWLVEQEIMDPLRRAKPWMNAAFQQCHRDLAQALFQLDQWMALGTARIVRQRCTSLSATTTDSEGEDTDEEEGEEKREMSAEDKAARNTPEMRQAVQTIVRACNNGLLDSYFSRDAGLLAFLAPDAKPVVFALATRPRNALALAWFDARPQRTDGGDGRARIGTDFIVSHDKCREACDAHAAKCFFTYSPIPLPIPPEGTTRFALA
jgi:hypothetical protein